MFKLSGWVWLIVGIFLGLTVLSYGYFQHYQPDMEEARIAEEYAAKLEIEARKDQRAQDRIDKAEEMVKEIAEQWNQVLADKSPSGTLGADLDPFLLAVNAPDFRNRVQRAVNRQLLVGGVTVVQGPFVPSPANNTGVLQSYFNYNRLPFPVVVFELGSVTVSGTYEQIARNVQAWADMPDYFAVADGLAITGTSPDLTGTYNVVIVGFLPGEVSAPLAATSEAAPASPAGFGAPGVAPGGVAGPAGLGFGGAAGAGNQDSDRD